MGYRGYISSRLCCDTRIPQHVQNLVIRDYCARESMSYLLSAAEYAMPESYMMLQKILDDLANIEGIACYSLFQLPFDDKERRRIYKKVLKSLSRTNILYFSINYVNYYWRKKKGCVGAPF